VQAVRSVLIAFLFLMNPIANFVFYSIATLFCVFVIFCVSVGLCAAIDEISEDEMTDRQLIMTLVCFWSVIFGIAGLLTYLS
jgi:hypothetical protein